MAIISSEILSVSLQIDGTRDIQEKHTDNFERIYLVNYNAQPGIDINIQLLIRVPYLEEAILKSDLDNTISQIQSGIDPRNVFTYTATNIQVLRHILKWFRRNRARNAWLIIPLIDSLTDAQIMNALNITQDMVNAIRTRVDNLRAIKTTIESDDELVEEIE